MTRVVVTGGRNYADGPEVARVLDKIAPTALAHGACPTGADHLAGIWANSRGVPCWRYPADWVRLGPSAGPVRNRRMLVEFKPDLVVAFAGGPGTMNCVVTAEVLGIPVVLVA